MLVLELHELAQVPFRGWTGNSPGTFISERGRLTREDPARQLCLGLQVRLDGRHLPVDEARHVGREWQQLCRRRLEGLAEDEWVTGSPWSRSGWEDSACHERCYNNIKAFEPSRRNGQVSQYMSHPPAAVGADACSTSQSHGPTRRRRELKAGARRRLTGGRGKGSQITACR